MYNGSINDLNSRIEITNNLYKGLSSIDPVEHAILQNQITIMSALMHLTKAVSDESKIGTIQKK